MGRLLSSPTSNLQLPFAEHLAGQPDCPEHSVQVQSCIHRPPSQYLPSWQGQNQQQLLCTQVLYPE